MVVVKTTLHFRSAFENCIFHRKHHFPNHIKSAQNFIRLYFSYTFVMSYEKAPNYIYSTLKISCRLCIFQTFFIIIHGPRTLTATRFHTSFSLFRHFHQKRDATSSRFRFPTLFRPPHIYPHPPRFPFIFSRADITFIFPESCCRNFQDILLFLGAWRNQLGRSSVSLSRSSFIAGDVRRD